MFSSIKIRKIVSCLCVMIFAVHFASRQFYVHNHIIDGVSINHSHFHTNSHGDTDCGGHTKESILFIARTAQVECINTSSITIPSPSQFYPHLDKHVEKIHWIASKYLQNPTLRAPPTAVANILTEC